MDHLPTSPLAPTPLPQAIPVRGVQFFTSNTGLKYRGRDDLFLALLAEGTVGAGSFTQNQVTGAPVDWTRAALGNGTGPRALIVNAGNANVANGAAGAACCTEVAQGLASTLCLEAGQIWQASTGVIGEALAATPLIEAAQQALTAGEAAPTAAAAACLTTDTFVKMARRPCEIDGQSVTLSGFAKGSGMIQPNMATLLAFAFTDVQIEAEVLQPLHQRAVEATLNAITVDSDSSTSDMALTFATGQGAKISDFKAFEAELTALYQDLAKLVIRDGEGASKFIEITVHGAASRGEAKVLAFAVANSPLVKTTISGGDANWGRILMALGKAGVAFDPQAVTVALGGLPVVAGGARVDPYEESPVTAHLRGQEISLEIEVGTGPGTFRVWTCDLTQGYISINADYRS